MSHFWIRDGPTLVTLTIAAKIKLLNFLMFLETTENSKTT